MPDTILSMLRKTNRVIAILVGVMLLICASVVLIDIVLRQLGSSFGGTDEISGYVMAIATSWGMGYTLLELGHVRIDFLRSRASSKIRAVFDLFSLAVLCGTVSLIAIKCWPVLSRSLVNNSTANTPLETPLALVQGPWFAGWIWFACVAWMTFAAALALVFSGEFQKSEAVIGAFGEEDGLT